MAFATVPFLYPEPDLSGTSKKHITNEFDVEDCFCSFAFFTKEQIAVNARLFSFPDFESSKIRLSEEGCWKEHLTLFTTQKIWRIF
jgi:hypothetical protein